MRTRLIFSFLSSIVTALGLAQDKETLFLVQPYLQNANPNEMTIMWETTMGEESLVEYGETTKLGKKENGKADDVNFFGYPYS
jgi:hypothetical protein